MKYYKALSTFDYKIIKIPEFFGLQNIYRDFLGTSYFTSVQIKYYGILLTYFLCSFHFDQNQVERKKDK